ncbi:MBL fold metallo-hydrolase [Phormidium pseudopriestleyi FRX01]|uniref:MBL fold metallo-hydrolase n=1 Tax=Phormidium pseudopriestleyi FRX01 TaxID=1759528 RepID=A0ABS3FME7_9CYAN|nr:MBL fold metallo-hydrolase [Phormidium pseudopriestleyi]MBO0348265.1 MBL fold metallo-hydrolase [Phormidium pseudopriestleyi FRX01]
MNNFVAVTVLVENTASGRGLLGEHGVSYFIETAGSQILFDTGQGLALKHNAKQLEISFSDIDAVVLSHGHYDHAGGLMTVLENSYPRLFLHPSALNPKFSPRGDIGCPIQDPDILAQKSREVIWTETPTEIVPGVYVTGTIPRVHPLEDTGGQFWQDSQHNQVDVILDDQALFIETMEGVVVVLGCAHAGVINTLNYIATLTGEDKFYAVIGGMHLLNASADRLQATAETFRKYDLQLIGANHCTGMRAQVFLWQEFPLKCRSCSVGTRLLFGR